MWPPTDPNIDSTIGATVEKSVTIGSGNYVVCGTANSSVVYVGVNHRDRCESRS